MKKASIKETLFDDVSISNSFELLCFLRNRGFLSDRYEGMLEYWWPHYGSFEVVLGAILTQNAAWKRVEIALERLRERKWLGADQSRDIEWDDDGWIESMIACPMDQLMEAIKPSGLYQRKAQTIKSLAQAIKDTFGRFSCMQQECTRAWLLNQKGIGKESADSILCYALKREVMVADRYSDRLLKCLGYEFESYDEIQAWLTQGIYEHRHRLIELYQKPITLKFVFARFHGKIDEFVKEYKL